LGHCNTRENYEAGTADRGFGPLPYFAMEFIDSESLIEYAQVEPNVRQRLEIMGQVCEADHDARQRSIIYRI
jgi:hypothetical protein